MTTTHAQQLLDHRIIFEIVLPLAAFWEHPNDVLAENMHDESIPTNVLMEAGFSEDDIDIVQAYYNPEGIVDILREKSITGFLVLVATPTPKENGGLHIDDGVVTHGATANWGDSSAQWFFTPTLEELVEKAVHWGNVLLYNAAVVEQDEDRIVECALCGKEIWECDSYSPADDAICAECDTEVTGSNHPPSLNPATDFSPAVHKKFKIP